MDFEKMKENWKHDTDKQVVLPEKISKLKSMHPLERLKRNMRIEFFVQFVAVIALAFVPRAYHFAPKTYFIYYITYATFFVVAAYYFYDFYRFYGKIQQYSDNTKNTLHQLYYQLLLNVERYKSFAFLLIPYFLSCTCILIYNKLLSKNRSIETISENQAIVLFTLIISVIILYMLAVKLWVENCYGKYAKEIKSILEEMDEDKS